MSNLPIKEEAQRLDELADEFLKEMGLMGKPGSPVKDSKINESTSKKKGLFTDEEIDFFCTPKEKKK